MKHLQLLSAEWCVYCPVAKKIIDEVRKEYKNTFEYEEVDIDTAKGRNLALKFGIMSVPAIIIDDEVAFIGAPNKNKLIEKLGLN